MTDPKKDPNIKYIVLFLSILMFFPLLSSTLVPTSKVPPKKAVYEEVGTKCLDGVLWYFWGQDMRLSSDVDGMPLPCGKIQESALPESETI